MICLKCAKEVEKPHAKYNTKGANSMHNRVNILSFPHKALRNLLGKWNLQIASTDPEDSADVQAAVSQIHLIEHLLAEHAAHEDTYLQPLYNQYFSVDLAKQLEDEHVNLEKNLLHIEALAEQTAVSADRKSIWFEITKLVNQFIIDYLIHLQNEEYLCMPILWEKLTDADLRQLQQQMMAATDPLMMPQMLSNGLPALNPGERIGFLSALKRSLPEPVFTRVSQVAHQALGEENWNQIALKLAEI
jgi:hypothetical protein